MKIKNIIARQILDSRGTPTVEADVILENGLTGRAAVPSGASTGSHEAIELRDGNKNYFFGKSVLSAVKNVNNIFCKKLKGSDVTNQNKIDRLLINLDGTENKARLGANSILAVSLASAKAAANFKNQQFFEYIHEISETKEDYLMPIPMMNIINGGKHAAGSCDIQEFMIMPTQAKSFSQAIQMGAEVFHALSKILTSHGYSTTVGDEGGFAPHVKSGNKEALNLIREAVDKTNFILGKDIYLALDVASSELYEDNKYKLSSEGRVLTRDEMIGWYDKLRQEYPIISIEDGLFEDDWEGWRELTTRIGNKIQLVGDDLLVTNTKFLKKAIKNKAANAILIKVNQIGTLSETINAVKMAKENNFKVVISHRSGETEDTTIAHLAVGLSSGQIKTGSLSRTDRVAKYNELLRIEEYLGSKAVYPSKTF